MSFEYAWWKQYMNTFRLEILNVKRPFGSEILRLILDK
jgi:hypothetical protein